MYEIFLNDKTVGCAEVKIEGLYYLFSCSCTPPDREIYRVSVTDGRKRLDLGIVVPEGGAFALKKKIPCKYFSGDRFSFTLVGKTSPLVSIPVATGTAFEYLDVLETAHLQVEDGQSEIVIDPVQAPQDSDLNQVPQNRWEQQ